MTVRKWIYLAAIVAVTLAGGFGVMDARAKYVEKKELTVKIRIKKYYKVHFDANGGAGAMGDQEFEHGVSQRLSESAFERDGYTFIGWNRVIDGGSQGDYYREREEVQDLTDVGEGVVTLYAQWEEKAMHKVFEIAGACVFHGYDFVTGDSDGHITGESCVSNGTDWADGTHTYIDTGVKLYDELHYNNDYEIGFTIVSYDYRKQYKEPTDNASQATFMNTKLEIESLGWPGLAIRKNNDKITITQRINRRPVSQNVNATVNKIVVMRTDGIVYYSVDGGPYATLQDMNNTSDYFDTNVWFGASSRADGTPMRYIDATLSNMYVMIGEKGANKHIVEFDAGGFATDPSNVALIGSSAIGSSLPTMPSSVEVDGVTWYFGGWYTEQDGAGHRIVSDSIIDSDMTLYAYWRDNNNVCNVGGVSYSSLSSCISATTDQETEITLLDYISEQVSIAGGKKVVLNLNGFSISDMNVIGQPVIENYGELTVQNGAMESSLNAAVINNNGSGKLYVENGAKIIANGTRQAIYNDGGSVTIRSGAYLSAAAVAERATVHNLNGGELIIEGGVIISKKQEGVKNDGGSSVAIGVEDGIVSRGGPIIQGATYGIATNRSISVFDGELRGKTKAIDNPGMIVATEAGAVSVGIDPEETTIIDGQTYKILYYVGN